MSEPKPQNPYIEALMAIAEGFYIVVAMLSAVSLIGFSIVLVVRIFQLSLPDIGTALIGLGASFLVRFILSMVSDPICEYQIRKSQKERQTA